jgi:hypothetical protein
MTGWPTPPLLQEDSRELFKWFANRINSRQQVRETMETLYNREPSLWTKRLLYPWISITPLSFYCSICHCPQKINLSDILEEEMNRFFKAHVHCTLPPVKSKELK